MHERRGYHWVPEQWVPVGPRWHFVPGCWVHWVRRSAQASNRLGANPSVRNPGPAARRGNGPLPRQRGRQPEAMARGDGAAGGYLYAADCSLQPQTGLTNRGAPLAAAFVPGRTMASSLLVSTRMDP
jgi:hypothetical protein